LVGVSRHKCAESSMSVNGNMTVPEGALVATRSACHRASWPALVRPPKPGRQARRSSVPQRSGPPVGTARYHAITRSVSNRSHTCAKNRYNQSMDYVAPIEAVVPGVQGRVLSVLARTDTELTMRSVAQLAGVSVNRAVSVLNHLIALGLVERREAGSGLPPRNRKPSRSFLVVPELFELHR